jgi:Cof subfamily protein (haloacid dehalogenase superfamily)
MLALDVDGTLVHETRVVPDRTRDVVRAAVAAGIRVSIVTGRMPTSGLRFAAQLGLVDPIVGYQGAVVREIRGAGDERPGRLLFHEPISVEGGLAAVRWAHANGLTAHVNHLERFIIQDDDPRWPEYQAFLGALAHPVRDIFEVLGRPVSKITAVGDPPRPESLVEAARIAVGHVAQPTISHPRFLEFVAPGVTKGRALRWLARRQGIPLEQVMAIGDQLNDLEMVQAVGHGVAMTNAPDALKLRARYVAPSVFEQGAADIIEALVLAGPDMARRNAARFLAEAHIGDPLAAGDPRGADRQATAEQVDAREASRAGSGIKSDEPLSEPSALPEPLEESR